MDSLINIPPIEMPGIFVCKSIVMRGTEGNGGEEERVNAGRLRRLRGTRTHLYIFIRVRSVKHERVHRRARMRARECVRARTMTQKRVHATMRRKTRRRETRKKKTAKRSETYRRNRSSRKSPRTDVFIVQLSFSATGEYYGELFPGQWINKKVHRTRDT